VPGAHFLARG